MNSRLSALLATNDGVLTWAEAVSVVPAHVVTHATRSGQVVRPFPGVLVAAAQATDPGHRRRAALRLAGPSAALSHVSALATWGLPADDADGVHVVTGCRRRIRVPGIVAHRRSVPLDDVPRAGLRVTRLEQALVEAWPLRVADAQRAPLMAAVGGRLTTPERVAAVLDRVTNLAGRRDLAGLIDKLLRGCRSELELWGYDRVFNDPGMPAFAWQVPVRLPGRTVYLDVLHEPTKTNFELDGAKWHAGPEQRERDLRRDAALAVRGFTVVRFSHDRLVREPDVIRAEVLAVLAAAELRRLTG